MPPTERIIALLKQRLENSLSATDETELQEWMNQSEDHRAAIADLLNEESLQVAVRNMYRSKVAVWSKIDEAIPDVKVRKIYWRRWAAAAAILIIALGSYFIFSDKKSTEPFVAEVKKDIKAPKLTKATITLADGRQISVDSLTKIAQGNVHVEKMKDGDIVYVGKHTEVIYNTLVNPRGSVMANLTLSDGTKVWLNSESSLRYPVSFNGDARNVEITGEAYFEVAKDPRKKFIVTANGLMTEVLGTHFNINTYPDESSKNVTLLEGRIKVNNILIQPGQQAQVTNAVKVIANVNTEAVMAWKNGQFIMSGTDIPTLMRQISRWYDVEVKFAGSVPSNKFGGTVSREVDLAILLQALGKSGIRYKLENKTIIIL